MDIRKVVAVESSSGSKGTTENKVESLSCGYEVGQISLQICCNDVVKLF